MTKMTIVEENLRDEPKNKDTLNYEYDYGNKGNLKKGTKMKITRKVSQPQK